MLLKTVSGVRDADERNEIFHQKIGIPKILNRLIDGVPKGPKAVFFDPIGVFDIRVRHFGGVCHQGVHDGLDMERKPPVVVIEIGDDFPGRLHNGEIASGRRSDIRRMIDNSERLVNREMNADVDHFRPAVVEYDGFDEIVGLICDIGERVSHSLRPVAGRYDDAHLWGRAENTRAFTGKVCVLFRGWSPVSSHHTQYTSGDENGKPYGSTGCFCTDLQGPYTLYRMHTHTPQAARKTESFEADGVTAVVSAYRSERFLAGRMENLLGQTLYSQGRLEIVVIDACSPEREGEVVRTYLEKYPNISYLRTDARESVYASWNRGFSMARGAYVINANTDDRFAEDALECLADSLASHPEISATYGNWLVTGEENDTFESPSKKFLFEYPEFKPPLFLYFQITSHAAMLRRSVFEEVGPFNEQMTVFGDREWMLRFCKKGHRAAKIHKTVGLYLVNKSGLEASNPKGKEEFLSLREQYLKEEDFCSLFGLKTVPAQKALARLYASAGSMGRHFYHLPSGPVSDYVFSANLLMRALRLDPADIVALNNLAGIFAAEAEWSKAASLLKAARLVADESQKPLIMENQRRLEGKEGNIETFGWLGE